MPVFVNTEEINMVMRLLWQRIKEDPGMSKKLVASKLTIQFHYHNPEGLITIDCSDGQEMKIIVGPTPIQPIIRMSMKADVAHNFWLGKVNITLALMNGEIVSKGPTPKALTLLPVIKPAFALYPQVLKDTGHEALVSL